MVYVPQSYVSGGNQKPQQQAQTSSNSSYAPASTYNPYATQSSATSTQSNVYAPSGTTTTTSNVYAPLNSTQHKPSNNVYAPVNMGLTPFSSSTPSSAYAPAPAASSNAYSSQPAMATSHYKPAGANTYGGTSRTTASSALPDFSQALDHPAPPTQAPAPVPASNYNPYGSQTTNTSQYQTATKSPNDFPMATAVDVTGVPMVGTSSVNSSVYQGGPTNGLVSEGNPTQCHKVDYEIKGHEMQLVEIELDPSETVIAEAGAMMFLDDGIDFKAKFGDGSEPKQSFWKKIMSAGGRILTGESLFLTHFTNRGSGKARVAFAAPYPGTIVPVNMANIGNSLICQRDAFLCAAKGTSLKMHFHKKLGSGLFGGEGFILQKLKGDGMAFIHAGGTVIKRELRGERLRLDTGCLVAFTSGINYDVQMVPGLKSMFFGGEGLFLVTLQGTGTVWIQSLPFSRMCDRIVQSAPSIGGRRKGEGSALMGGLGGLLDGDGF